MTDREAIAYLTERGYRVTRAREPRAPSPKGRRHRDCAAHEQVDGYRDPICILRGQDRESVLAFAREIAAIARRGPLAVPIATAA